MTQAPIPSQGGLDLEALRAEWEHGTHWRNTCPVWDSTGDAHLADWAENNGLALIDRVRELSAERDHAISQSKHMSRLFNEQTARLASLRRVREAAVEAVHYGTGKYMAKLASVLTDEKGK